MPLPLIAEETVQVALVSAGARASLGVMPMAQHFGLTAGQAEYLLARGHGVVARGVTLAQAQAALPVLASLGIRLAIQPTDAGHLPEDHDLSIRLTNPQSLPAVAEAIRRHGGPVSVTEDDFRGPAGLELCGLTHARDLAAALSGLAGVKVVLCKQGGALYDVFAPRHGIAADLAPVLRHLATLNCSAEDHCPPIAVGLDRRMLTHVLRRFPDVGLLGVNQRFQRYDLTLVGLGRLSEEDLSGFLATRGLNPAKAIPALQARRSIRLESGLTRAMAKAFVSDYATIGMAVRADLLHG